MHTGQQIAFVAGNLRLYRFRWRIRVLIVHDGRFYRPNIAPQPGQLNTASPSSIVGSMATPHCGQVLLSLLCNVDGPAGLTMIDATGPRLASSPRAEPQYWQRDGSTAPKASARVCRIQTGSQRPHSLPLATF
jgi:hypothetical protein